MGAFFFFYKREHHKKYAHFPKRVEDTEQKGIQKTGGRCIHKRSNSSDLDLWKQQNEQADQKKNEEREKNLGRSAQGP
ncbi:hypothetical protein D3C75_977250 [compost metagenome]